MTKVEKLRQPVKIQQQIREDSIDSVSRLILTEPRNNIDCACMSVFRQAAVVECVVWGQRLVLVLKGVSSFLSRSSFSCQTNTSNTAKYFYIRSSAKQAIFVRCARVFGAGGGWRWTPLLFVWWPFTGFTWTTTYKRAQRLHIPSVLGPSSQQCQHHSYKS